MIQNSIVSVLSTYFQEMLITSEPTGELTRSNGNNFTHSEARGSSVCGMLCTAWIMEPEFIL